MKSVVFAKTATQALLKMPSNTASRIRAKIFEYAADLASQANNVKRLRGETAIRLRVGDWRVLMEDGVVLEVQRIAPRGSAYD